MENKSSNNEKDFIFILWYVYIFDVRFDILYVYFHVVKWT